MDRTFENVGDLKAGKVLRRRDVIPTLCGLRQRRDQQQSGPLAARTPATGRDLGIRPISGLIGWAGFFKISKSRRALWTIEQNADDSSVHYLQRVADADLTILDAVCPHAEILMRFFDDRAQD